jgi:UDP-GlcNAc3NAcA epimerase
MRMPEEQNRILTDRISTVLFCPTDQAMENLQNEGYANIDVDMLNVGDVMLDAATFYADNLKEDSQLPADYNQGNFILATCHRAENTDSKERLESIVSSLNKLSETFNVYLPLHPRTKKKMEEFGLSFSFQTLDPIGYFDMIRLLKDCSFVMTDSGGLQKEAYFFEKACLTMRDETEWVELVNNGVNKLVGADKDLILSSASEIQSGKLNFKEGLYGDKKASEKIIQYLLDH